MIRELATALFGLAASPAAEAQRVGLLDRPCAELPPAPADVGDYLAQRTAALATGTQLAPPPPRALKLYNDWQDALRADDFAGLCRSNGANAALPVASDRRIVFFGD